MPCLLQLTRRQCSNPWYYGNCEQMLIVELTETVTLGVWSMTPEHMLRSVPCMTSWQLYDYHYNAGMRCRNEIVCASQIYTVVITQSCLGRTGTYFDLLAFLQTRWLWWCHTLPWDSQLRGRSRPELALQSGSQCSWVERMHLQTAETSHSSAGEDDSIVETE